MTTAAAPTRHLLVTGLTGTVGPRVAAVAAARGWRVSGWDRRELPVDGSDAAGSALYRLAPDAIVHLALGASDWTVLLARHAARRALPFVFTSTAMVFDHVPDGPHDVADERTARDDYGRGKIADEDAVREAHPHACIARLGWQVDPGGQGNNLVRELSRWQARDGHVRASTRWIPACGFLDDTAAALVDLVERPIAGVVHLDANADDAWTFERLARALDARHALGWHVVADDSQAAYAHDQRLVGGPVRLPALSTRLRG